MSLRETIPLQQTKIIKKSVLGLLIPLTVLIFLFTNDNKAFICNDPMYSQILVTLLLVTIPIVPIYQLYYFRKYFYDSDATRLTVKKGVVTPKEITLPYSRITDVYIDQDILDVMFNLCDVHVSTATQELGIFAHIDGVSKEDGEKLKKLILDKLDNA